VSREEAFARDAAADLAALHTVLGFKDRRQEGRRYRPTDWISELDGPRKPYPPSPAPADLPSEAFVRGW
jgi:hypothetical protein